LFLGKKYYQKIKRYKKNIYIYIYIKDNLGKKTHVKPKKTKNKKKHVKKKQNKTKYKKNYNTSPTHFRTLLNVTLT
jgi:hypothetical protein